MLWIGLTGCGRSHLNEPSTDSGVPMGDSARSRIDSGGRDAGRISADSGAMNSGRIDAGIRASCVAAEAQAAVCQEAICEEEPRWYWNGDSCYPIECGTCEGPDCGKGYENQSLCLDAHRHCEATLCQESGGTWQWWTGKCSHYRCGIEGPGDCLAGRPVCDCGLNRRFDSELGCVVDRSCPPPEPPA